MSVVAIGWARGQDCPSPAHKLLLMLLADYASPKESDPRHVCWPSQATLAVETGQSERTIRRHLEDLERLGLVVRESRGSPEGGRLTDRYVIPLPASLSGKGGGYRTTPPAATGQSEGGLPDTRVQGTIREPKENPHTAAFAAFWERYPRKVGKAGALRAWESACRKVEPEVILAGLARQVPHLEKQEVRYVPHPSTWLNQGRWEDETPRATPARRDDGWR